ncbi:MAG: hypothetical protein FWG70_02490 [Oscillospiraceae bacterium]|nr:hypothetical protein [Oscillospiraceae bacterium]
MKSYKLNSAILIIGLIAMFTLVLSEYSEHGFSVKLIIWPVFIGCCVIVPSLIEIIKFKREKNAEREQKE